MTDYATVLAALVTVLFAGIALESISAIATSKGWRQRWPEKYFLSSTSLGLASTQRILRFCLRTFEPAKASSGRM